MELTFNRSNPTRIDIPEAGIKSESGKLFEISLEGIQIATLLDQQTFAAGIFKGRKFTTNERTVFESSLQFILFDDENKAFAVAAPANVFKLKKIRIEFPQHDLTLNVRRISGLFIRNYQKGNIEFYSGNEILCTVWPTGKIEMADHLAPEILIPLMLMYNRFENYKKDQDSRME